MRKKKRKGKGIVDRAEILPAPTPDIMILPTDAEEERRMFQYSDSSGQVWDTFSGMDGSTITVGASSPAQVYSASELTSKTG